jgi:hypothetical protein
MFGRRRRGALQLLGCPSTAGVSYHTEFLMTAPFPEGLAAASPGRTEVRPSTIRLAG